MKKLCKFCELMQTFAKKIEFLEIDTSSELTDTRVGGYFNIMWFCEIFEFLAVQLTIGQVIQDLQTKNLLFCHDYCAINNASIHFYNINFFKLL